MRSCLASALAAVLVLATPIASSTAFADPKPMSASARRELERGDELFKAGDYATAIATFDAGFAIEPHPDFLYAKGQAQRMSGDYAGAIESFRGFLASSPPQREAEATRYNIARCEAELAKARATPPVEPGPVVTTVDAPPWYRDALGGVLAGGALIGLGVGATLLVLADRNVDAANDAENLDDWYIQSELVHTRRTVGVVSLVVGGALATAAVIRYATRPSRVEITPPAAGTGAVITIGGTF